MQPLSPTSKPQGGRHRGNTALCGCAAPSPSIAPAQHYGYETTQQIEAELYPTISEQQGDTSAAEKERLSAELSAMKLSALRKRAAAT
eukprot:SAG31_NODE_12811_length_914_cov_6.069939_1_plen_87_part_10